MLLFDTHDVSQMNDDMTPPNSSVSITHELLTVKLAENSGQLLRVIACYSHVLDYHATHILAFYLEG